MLYDELHSIYKPISICRWWRLVSSKVSTWSLTTVITEATMIKDFGYEVHILNKDHDVHYDPWLNHAHDKSKKKVSFLENVVCLSFIGSKVWTILTITWEKKQPTLWLQGKFYGSPRAVQLRIWNMITTRKQGSNHFTILVKVVKDTGIKRDRWLSGVSSWAVNLAWRRKKEIKESPFLNSAVGSEAEEFECEMESLESHT